MKRNIFLLIAIPFLLSVYSCSKNEPEDPIIPNEEEVITTLKYTLTPENGGSPVVFSFQDLDGDGGVPPIFTGGTLDTNTSYTGALILLNELENPAENITEEIEEEAINHQFFYQASFSAIDITYADMDNNGNPIGLATMLTTTNASSGTLTIILRHEPNKNAAEVSDGDISNAGGETDIEVTFDVEVQ